jgi:4-amino-4-deoxy-L-arabinose transferase-like glycosyltransferase
MTDRRRLVLLALTILAATVTYLVGNGSMALWDRDEPRYAQTSRQMVESGDWVVPRFLDLPRTAKPALIYWCQAAAMRVFGTAGDGANFAARLPSAVGIALLLVVLSVVLWRRVGPQRTLWTVFIFATSGLTIAAAKMCITDAVLLLWVTAAQLCLYAAWRGRATWPVVITWAVMTGLAGLTKGPVILGMQGMTVLALWLFRTVDRRWRPTVLADAPEPASASASRPWLKSWVAGLIVVAIVLPWVLMVNARAVIPPAATVAGAPAVHESFIMRAFRHDVWDRMMTPLEQHAGPPGYYFLSVWATFFPWSLLLPLAVGLAWHRRADARSRFALAAVVGPWVMLECVRTKLPHYFLPAFPFLAYLTADALVRCLSGEIGDLRGRLFKVVVSVWAVVIAAVASAPWLVLGHYEPLPIGAMVALSATGLTFAATVAALVWREQLAVAAVTLGVGTMALVLLACGVYLPRADFLRVSPRVARVLADHGVTGRGQCIMLDYMEPSLAWAQGGTIREAGGVGFGPKFEPQFTPWMVMTEQVWDRAPADLRAKFDRVADVYGLAYADRGRWVHVLVVHRR